MQSCAGGICAMAGRCLMHTQLLAIAVVAAAALGGIERRTVSGRASPGVEPSQPPCPEPKPCHCHCFCSPIVYGTPAPEGVIPGMPQQLPTGGHLVAPSLLAAHRALPEGLPRPGSWPSGSANEAQSTAKTVDGGGDLLKVAQKPTESPILQPLPPTTVSPLATLCTKTAACNCHCPCRDGGRLQR